MTSQPFRLLDLPQELQNQIYAKYYEGTELIMRRVERRDTILFSQLIKFHPLPSLALELTSRKVFNDSRKVRQVAWPRKLSLVDLLGIKFWILQLAEHSKYQWLRNHIESFEFNGKEYIWVENAGIEELIKGCPNLQRIYFQLEVNKGFSDDDSMIQFIAAVKEQEVIACAPAGRGFEEIGSYLKQVRGPDASLSIVQTTHCRVRNEVRHALDPNGALDAFGCIMKYKFDATKKVLEMEDAEIVQGGL